MEKKYVINFSHVNLVNKNKPFFQPEYYYCHSKLINVKTEDCKTLISYMTFTHKTNLDKNQIRITTNPKLDEIINEIILFIEKKKVMLIINNPKIISLAPYKKQPYRPFALKLTQFTLLM